MISMAVSAMHRLLLPALLAATPSFASAAPSPDDFTGLELEQLMALEVSGITGRSTSYVQSPAAVWVITGDEIRRSGFRSLADVLRLAPGVQVLRRNAQDYTVTSRGFGGDKLQVLVDGRSAYSPLQSEVFWDVLDTYFEDIARIEVIRGPGATVWGANAVNGVINIVTKSAGDTRGVHLHGGGGSEERAFAGFRAGGAIEGFGHGRLYAQGRERDSSARADGSDFADGQRKLQAGGRLDGFMGPLGALTITGDVYSSRTDFASPLSPAQEEGKADGRNFGLRWTHVRPDFGETITSLYYDGYDRDLPGIYRESRDTYDLNLQQNFAPTGAHRFTAGVGARLTRDSTGNQLVLFFDPAEATRRIYSAFVQDEITLGRWSLVLGSKFENDKYTDLEVQPGVRLGWSVNEAVYTWAAISRAVRTPNRLERDIRFTCTGIPGVDPAPCTMAGDVLEYGNPDLESETVLAYEWGIRSQLQPTLFADLATFYNDYRDLRSTDAVNAVIGNDLDAESHGAELALSWEPMASLSVQPFYNFIRIHARPTGDTATTASATALEDGTPRQRAGVRVHWQLLPTVSASSFVRYVDRIPNQRVPDYVAVNLRLGWHLTPLMELALIGQNLGDPSHPEAGANPATRSEVERAVFGELIWRWQ